MLPEEIAIAIRRNNFLPQRRQGVVLRYRSRSRLAPEPRDVVYFSLE